MVSKHRRSDDGPVLAPVQAPLSTAEFWSEEVGPRQADFLASRRPTHARALGSPISDGSGPIPVYGFAAQDADPEWSSGSGVPSWEDWGPPPALYPDHPSAPVPRVRVRTDRTGSADHTGAQPAANGRGPRTAQRQPVNPAGPGPQRAAGGLPQRATAPQRPGGQYRGPGTSGNASARAGAQQLGFAAPPGYAPQDYVWGPNGQPVATAAQAYAEPQHYAGTQDYAQPQDYAGPPGYAEPQDYAGRQAHVISDTDARPQGYSPRRAGAAPRGRAVAPGRARAQGAAATEALANPYPNRHGFGEPDTYDEPDAYRDPEAYSEPRGYQAARGRLYAVPAEPPRSAPSTHDPRYYAASIREAAEEEAAAIRRQAADEAAVLTRQASEEAAKIREAAEKEAAELRAALLAMQGELGRVAAYVTENLTVPTIPAARPAEAPVTLPRSPAASPVEPDTRPARPGATPTRQARPSAKPTTVGRQGKVMRRMAAAFAIVSVFGAAAGITELSLHGFQFFIFRANGAGASETGPTEPVNPVLPPAPKANH